MINATKGLNFLFKSPSAPLVSGLHEVHYFDDYFSRSCFVIGCKVNHTKTAAAELLFDQISSVECLTNQLIEFKCRNRFRPLCFVTTDAVVVVLHCRPSG